MTLPTLLAQEDVSVEFSFKNPNEYICEIRNKTKYRMNILLSKEEFENRSALYFDIVDGTDTIHSIYYSLMKEADQRRFLYLDPAQAYTVSYKDGYKWEFVKTYIIIYYSVIIPNTEPKYGTYFKDTDLLKIKYLDNDKK